MVRLKRLFAWIMAVSLMLGLMAGNAAEIKAAAQPAITWDSAVEGGYLTLRLSGSNFSEIMQLGLTITYEDSFLTLMDYDDTALTNQVDGVHPSDIKSDSQDGKLTFSVFINDGALTFKQSEILELRFHISDIGQQELLFGLEVTECRKNTEESVAEVSVHYDSEYTVPYEGSGSAESYGCALIRNMVGRVQVGRDADVELYFYQRADILSGSLELVYNPEELKYQGCRTDLSGLRIEEAAQEGGPAALARVKILFRFPDVAIVTGEFLHFNFLPVKDDCIASVKIEQLQLQDDAGLVELSAKTSVSLPVMDDSTANRFTLTGPQQIFGTKEFELKLGINHNEGFHIMEGSLAYDPDLVEFVGGEFTVEQQNAMGSIEKNGEGTLRLQRICPKLYDDNGVIASLRFRSKGSADMPAYFHFQILDKPDSFVQLGEGEDGQDRSLASVPGSCAVRLAEPCTTHAWDSGVETWLASYTSAGTILYTCTRCGETKEEKTALLPLAKTQLASADNTSAGIELKWKKTAGASGYQIYRKTGSGSYKKLATVKKAAIVSYKDSKVSSGKTYTYQVRAYNSAQTGTAKNSLKRMYLGAVSLSSAVNASGGIQLKWNKAAGAKGYTVYRKTGSGAYQKLATAKAASYTDKTAKQGKKYTYKVAAYSGSYTGASGSTKTAVRLAQPAISSVSSKKAAALTVKCKKNTGVDGYQIQISTSSKFKTIAKSAKVSSKKAVSKQFTKLKKGTKYYVRVRTYKKSGKTTYYSAWSSTKSKKTAK